MRPRSSPLHGLAAVLAFVLVVVVIVDGVRALVNSDQGRIPLCGVQGQAYYVEDPGEVAAMQDAGLCPRTVIAAPIPDAYLATYWGYYHGPRYRPFVVHRSLFARRVHVFEVHHRTLIAHPPARPAWRTTTMVRQTTTRVDIHNSGGRTATPRKVTTIRRRSG